MRAALALLLVAVACKGGDKPAPTAAATPAPTATGVNDGGVVATPDPPHEDRHQAAIAPAHLALAIDIAGVRTQWGEKEFTSVAKIAGTATDGEARDTWSLRELVHQNVGATARVVAVLGAEGTVPIDPNAWADAKRTPILHTTRKGSLKFRWADPAGAWGPTVVKDVVGLVVTK